MSLFLKYRPKSFADIVGQKHITDILLAQAQKGAFAHNYLLYGPRGTGKTSSARLLGKMVNATTDDIVTDPASQIIDKGQTLDFIEIDAASHTGVDNIRDEIIDKALYPPTHLKKKVYIIDEVHMLSKGAFNALLKIMEEPPSYLMFILATTEINKVPDTIISRSQVFNFKKISLDDIVTSLENIAQQESIPYEEPGLRLIAKLSSGALRDAIKYLEQISMLGTVTADNVSQFLGVVADTVIEQCIEYMQSGDMEATFSYIDDLYAGGTDLHNFAKDVLLWLDEHFGENPAEYSRLAGMFKEIYADIKKYPYPVLVYKSKLYHWFESDNSIESVKKKASSLTSSKQKSIVEEEKVAFVREKQEEETLVVNTSRNDALAGTDDYTQLMQSIIDKVDKVMIKSILKNNAIIDSIDDGLVTIIVIHEQYYTTLQKPETIGYITDIISNMQGSLQQVKLVYMTKEQYLQKAMS